MKKLVSLVLSTTVMSLGVVANDLPNTGIYPFVPFETQEIISKIKNFAEDKDAVFNIYQINKMGLKNGKTKIQPWTSTYWPLNKGLIADPYKPSFQVFRPLTELSWKKNYNLFLKRKNTVHKNIDQLSDEELALLAPSEKYDLLLGDQSFHLTNRLWDYAYRWGSKKEHGFLSSINMLGGEAYSMAIDMVDSGEYESLEAAMARAIETKGGLIESIAQDLVNQGKYNRIVDALSEATHIAKSDLPQYELVDKNQRMALWEGICHGWATAAGIVPRPTKPVDVKLPDGRNLRFFPDDLKGIAALLWANSLVQDSKYIDPKTGENIGGGVIWEGLRCNLKSPKRDRYGRTYDDRKDPYSRKLEPRCVGIHPAVWHLILTNVVGKQGRSIIVERKVKAPVDNNPLHKYTAKYFNPKTGKYGSLRRSIIPVRRYKDDPFKTSRNPDTYSIVGVELTMTYMRWVRPQRETYDSPAKDTTKDITMMYDLELDKAGNIVGGQWRVVRDGKPFLGRANVFTENNQPDFAWAITKDWKKFFKENTAISKWKDTKSTPPSDWMMAARSAHNFKYFQTNKFGWYKKCQIRNKKTGEFLKVPCEFIVNRPQPLVNVVNKLIELSRK
jgi:hypothetical protein